jgi:hypothetical protein
MADTAVVVLTRGEVGRNGEPLTVLVDAVEGFFRRTFRVGLTGDIGGGLGAYLRRDGDRGGSGMALDGTREVGTDGGEASIV